MSAIWRTLQDWRSYGVPPRWVSRLIGATWCRVARHVFIRDENPYGEAICHNCGRWLSWDEADHSRSRDSWAQSGKLDATTHKGNEAK